MDTIAYLFLFLDLPSSHFEHVIFLAYAPRAGDSLILEVLALIKKMSLSGSPLALGVQLWA